MDKQDGAAALDPRHRRNAPVASGTPAAGSNVILRPGGPSSASTPARRPGSRQEPAWLRGGSHRTAEVRRRRQVGEHAVADERSGKVEGSDRMSLDGPT